MALDPAQSERDGARGRTPRLAALTLLFVLPLALRLAPIRHGLPVTSYVPDAHVVRGALGMAQERSLVPPAGRYPSYPYLLPYLLLPIYAGEYALGRASGEWAGAGEFGMRLLEEPARAHLPARVLVALFGALTPWVVLRASRAMGLERGAWVAAWLVATGLLHVHFSVQERPWVPMAFFIALSAWSAAAYQRKGGARALVGSAAAAGLAFATHQGGLLALGIPGLAWLAGPPGWSGGDLARRAKLAAAGLIAFAVLALAAGHPYLLVHGAAEPEHVSGGLGGAVQVGGQGFTYRFRLASFLRMMRALFGYDPALMVLGVLGIPLALRRRAAWPVTVFALVWTAVFITNFNDHVRYLMPLAVVLAPAAGFAAELLWRSRPARALVLVLLCLPLVQSTRLGWLLSRTDTRAIAAERLREVEGRVAIDVYGPEVPLDLASLERLAGFRELYAREDHRRALLAAGIEAPGGPGLDVVPVADLFDFNTRSAASAPKAAALALGGDPNAVFAALGVTHVLLVDRNPGDGVAPLLLDARSAPPGEPKLPLLRIDPEPIFVVSPARGASEPEEARLPTELDFPLVALWSVSRPGPKLALHRLAEHGG